MLLSIGDCSNNVRNFFTSHPLSRSHKYITQLYEVIIEINRLVIVTNYIYTE